MERSNHRIRTLPTEDLIAELVVRLVDAMVDSDIERLETPRARRVFRELSRREGLMPPSTDACTCAECMGDLYEGESGPGPFEDRGRELFEL